MEIGEAQNLDSVLGVLALIELGEAIAALVLDKRALTNINRSGIKI